MERVFAVWQIWTCLLDLQDPRPRLARAFGM
jgi:hypothetical protein